MKPERWTAALGFPEYEVSDRGAVRRTSGPTGGRYPIGTPLRGESVKGYRRAHLRRDGSASRIMIHRLVLTSFSGVSQDPAQTQVNHKNGKRDDNRLENLEWSTNRENNAHSWEALGRRGPCGTSIRASHLVESDIVDIRRKHALGEAVLALAAEYRVSGVTVYAIVKRKTWKHLT